MSQRLADCLFLHSNHYPRCKAVVDKHFVGYCSFQFMTEGSVDLSYNGRTHRLSGSWFWPTFPGPRIAFSRAAGCAYWNHRYVAVRGPLVDDWRVSGLWPSAPQPAPTGEGLAERFDDILALAKDPDPWRQKRAVNALEAMLLILTEARGESARDSWLHDARRLLTQGDGSGSGVDEAATACAMPPSTFRRRFKEAVGLSPRDFALVNRLSRARRRLLTDRRPIAAIAEELGYSDVYFFSRQFRAHTGMSPAAYRRSHM
jgi:AraC-like DNA-binding protein